MHPFNGDGLDFVINVSWTYSHDWATFALWYSLQRNLPDATLTICPKGKFTAMQLFSWCKKCNVSFMFNKPSDGFVIKPYIMMIRGLPEDCVESFKNKGVTSFCCDCRDDEYLPFVSYNEGFGNFVISRWINSVECPFDQVDRFMTHDANCNMVRILKLWKQMSPIYANLSR